MIVQASRMGLAAQSSVSVMRERTETTRAWVGDRRPDFESMERGGAQANRDRLVVSRQARDALEAQRALLPKGGENEPQAASKAKDSSEIELSPQDELKIRMIEDLLSQVLGREVKLSRFKGVHRGDSQDPSLEDPQTSSKTGGKAKTAEPPRAGWGVESIVDEKSVTAEKMAFRAAGHVTTADGKSVEFGLELSMERVTLEQSHLEVRMGDAVRKDPLVVNFAGSAAQLTDTAFSFDLDADGTMDSVRLATGNSAFLARNPGSEPLDGRILFGTRTGDGFGELALLDEDGNGWIDEGDGAWNDLRLWSRDEQGQDSLRTLAESGVGALYLGSVATPWEMEGGAVARTGVWLGEQGGAGTLQHVDLDA